MGGAASRCRTFTVIGKRNQLELFATALAGQARQLHHSPDPHSSLDNMTDGTPPPRRL